MKLSDVLTEIKEIRSQVHESDADEIDSKLGELETKLQEAIMNVGAPATADEANPAAKG